MKYRVFLKIVAHALVKKAHPAAGDGRRARQLYGVWKRRALMGRACRPSRAPWEYGKLVDLMD
jgi:hypothetical protein